MAAHLVAVPLTMGLGVGGTLLLRGALGPSQVRPPSLARAALTLVGFLVAVWAPGVIMYRGAGTWYTPVFATYVGSAVVFLGFGLVGLGVARCDGLRWSGGIIVRGKVGSHVALGLIGGTALFGVGGLIRWLGTGAGLTTHSVPLVAVSLSVLHFLCLGAWAEEVLYRWLLLDALRRVLGLVWAAKTVQAILFSVLHVPALLVLTRGEPTHLWLGVPWVGAIGFALGVLRVNANALLPCIAAHAAYDALSLLFAPA